MKRFFILISILLLATFCATDKEVPQPGRTFKMGFQNSAPRFETELVFKVLNIWIEKADAAIISIEVPWENLYQGYTAEEIVIEKYYNLVQFYRSKGMELWVYIDPVNGIDRTSDAYPLVEMGKSITMEECQLFYKGFVHAMNDVLDPDHLGLVLESNLIRDNSPELLYKAICKIANETAQEIQNKDGQVKLSVSVQAEWAWGKLGNGNYKGIEQDFKDFPFIQELGISSYPYLGFKKPQDIPLDYYSKLLNGREIKNFVVEGGWTSKTVASYESNPDMQKEYMQKHATILENAKSTGLFQLTFTDIDIAHLPPDTPEIFHLFVYTGLLDVNLNEKPILAEWDKVFNYKLISN